ncbi:condensation domain-containing protein [Endozoicomonas sp. Mp262]|uniref:condensation domain-containing protein n=1 Tax=Endozoicomonas sp. Mp262 TaxID=2919499 RepID=UPI0021D9D119
MSTYGNKLASLSEIFGNQSEIDNVKHALENSKANGLDKQYWLDKATKISCIDNEVLTNNYDALEKDSIVEIKEEIIDLDPETSDLIISICHKNNATPFSLFSTLFTAFYSRIFQCSELSFEYPVSTRPRENRDLYGFYVDILPFYVHIENNDSLLSLLNKVARQRKEDSENKHGYDASLFRKYTSNKILSNGLPRLTIGQSGKFSITAG